MNQTVKALIIDDEKLARDIVKKYLSSINNIELLGECTDGFDGVKKISELKPDLIFLDIQMPKITGFEMLELLDDPPAIIFTTAYDQYALNAFEVNAVDYLLKPFSLERFREAIDKAILNIRNKSQHAKVIHNLITHTEKQNDYLQRIVIKDGSKISIVPAENICWLEAQDDYVMIHANEGKFLKQKTMKFFEQNLSSKDFVRIHRSYIVRVDQIQKIELLEKESYQVKLHCDAVLPVSKSGYSKLKDILNN